MAENYLKVLFLGDVVASSGCKYVAKHLNNIKFQHNIQLVIANGENSADGNGISPNSADSLYRAGVDVITTGNHVFRRKEIYNYMEENDKPIVRPLNYGENVSGKGYYVVDLGFCSACVINLMGRAFMTPIDNPFLEIEKILPTIKTPNIVIDFHAEATSEKKAMGFFLKGKVSAVIGTHTHVQTADETILDNHTAYITDAGMCGSKNSILGVRPDIIIENFVSYSPQKHEIVQDDIQINGVIFTLDYKNGKCISIERIQH